VSSAGRILRGEGSINRQTFLLSGVALSLFKQDQRTALRVFPG